MVLFVFLVYIGYDIYSTCSTAAAPPNNDNGEHSQPAKDLVTFWSALKALPWTTILIGAIAIIILTAAEGFATWWLVKEGDDFARLVHIQETLFGLIVFPLASNLYDLVHIWFAAKDLGTDAIITLVYSAMVRLCVATLWAMVTSLHTKWHYIPSLSESWTHVFMACSMFAIFALLHGTKARALAMAFFMLLAGVVICSFAVTVVHADVQGEEKGHWGTSSFAVHGGYSGRCTSTIIIGSK